jgi:TPR repeat protein
VEVGAKGLQFFVGEFVCVCVTYGLPSYVARVCFQVYFLFSLNILHPLFFLEHTTLLSKTVVTVTSQQFQHKGCEASMNNLGYLYKRGGNGILRDMPEAIFWFRRLASGWCRLPD